MVQHFLAKVNTPVACGFGANQAPTELQAFASQYTVKLILKSLVLPEQVTDFTSPNANVTRRHVFVRSNMPKQFGHHRLAKTHHLVVAFSLGVEICSSLSAAHRQSGQTVLERLLKAQELQHAQGNSWVKSQAAFIGPNRVIELHTPSSVDANIAFIISPSNTKRQHAVRFSHSFKDLILKVNRMFIYERHHSRNEFLDRLMKLWLAWIAFNQPCHETINITALLHPHLYTSPAIFSVIESGGRSLGRQTRLPTLAQNVWTRGN